MKPACPTCADEGPHGYLRVGEARAYVCAGCGLVFELAEAAQAAAVRALRWEDIKRRSKEAR